MVRGFTLKNRMISANSLPHLQGPEGYPADPIITTMPTGPGPAAAIVTTMGINDFNQDWHMPMRPTGHIPDFHLHDPQCQNYLLQLADAIHFHGSIACMGFFVASNKYPVLRRSGPMDPASWSLSAQLSPWRPFMDPTPEAFDACYKQLRRRWRRWTWTPWKRWPRAMPSSARF